MAGRSTEASNAARLVDYLVKPFSPGEPAARVRSELRRAEASRSGDHVDPDGLTVDPATREVTVAGRPVD